MGDLKAVVDYNREKKCKRCKGNIFFQLPKKVWLFPVLIGNIMKFWSQQMGDIFLTI